MNTVKRLAALLLAIAMLSFVGCQPSTTDPSDTTPPDVTPPDTTPSVTDGPSLITPPSDSKVYNIVFALATIPPVLAALDCIDSGYETYAIIERGKTYNGIDKLEYFHNAGFDPANNLSTGFTATEFDAMVQKVKELKGDNVFFNFYVQDGTALKGAAIAANAGLSTDSFVIYMCEDGTGAYNALRNSYVKNKTVTAERDEVYENYATAALNAKAEFEAVMAKTDNKNADKVLGYNIAKAFALASLPNFVYYLQDESIVVDALEATGDTKTKLLSSFGVEGYEAEVEYTLNLKYQKISEAITKLTEAERTDYLTLMYGDYYADTFAALTRTERAGETAPGKKLVFIGSRHSGYPKLASNSAYGIGGITGSVPRSYAELNAKYKTALLFEKESDYAAFLAVIDNLENYAEGTPAEIRELAAVACFNTYIDYIFNLKLTYALYGEDYDLIMKGHPREAIGCYDEWGNRYKVTVGEGESAQTYVYDKLLDSALLAFHKSDSVGKYIGMVPYGTAAENLAYLGADIAICGLPSSTYSGYDTDVDVLFILGETSEDITGNYSQVKERYEAGNLTYVDKNGEEKTAVYYNLGNIYKALASVYKQAGDNAAAESYEARYKVWLPLTHGLTAKDIDEQGFPVIN